MRASFYQGRACLKRVIHFALPPWQIYRDRRVHARIVPGIAQVPLADVAFLARRVPPIIATRLADAVEAVFGPARLCRRFGTSGHRIGIRNPYPPVTFRSLVDLFGFSHLLSPISLGSFFAPTVKRVPAYTQSQSCIAGLTVSRLSRHRQFMLQRLDTLRFSGYIRR